MPIDPLDILSILLVLSGLVFFLGASVGLLRFPDFYTRMHAAGKGDTLSTLLIMAGAGIYELHRFSPEDGSAIGVALIVVKIMAIGIFIMLTSPTSTHALMQVGYDDQLEPAGESNELIVRLPELGKPAPAPAGGAPEVSPSQRAAAELPPQPRQPSRKRATASKKKSAAGTKKKAAAKKSAAKKKSVKKAAVKKAAGGKRVTSKKKTAPAKKAVAKKAVKKAASKKAATKKSSAKKVTAKKKSPKRKKD